MQMESFLDSSFRFLDKESDIELEILKLISEQERNKCVEIPEIPNYDEVDEEIARLIQSFEEKKTEMGAGKPSLISVHHP